MSILKPEKNGKTGIKRVIGFILVIIAVILAITDQFTNYKVNFAVWSSLLGLGGALIGITAIPNIKQ